MQLGNLSVEMGAKIMYNTVVRREASNSKSKLLTIGLSVYQIVFNGNRYV
jgi:hypothetical protein